MAQLVETGRLKMVDKSDAEVKAKYGRGSVVKVVVVIVIVAVVVWKRGGESRGDKL